MKREILIEAQDWSFFYSQVLEFELIVGKWVKRAPVNQENLAFILDFTESLKLRLVRPDSKTLKGVINAILDRFTDPGYFYQRANCITRYYSEFAEWLNLEMKGDYYLLKVEDASKLYRYNRELIGITYKAKAHWVGLLGGFMGSGGLIGEMEADTRISNYRNRVKKYFSKLEEKNQKVGHSSNLFCRICGERIPGDSRFCPRCGEKIKPIS